MPPATLYVLPSRRDEFKRLLETNESVTGFEAQIRRRDGSLLWISENARAVRDTDGSVLYYEGTVQDITEPEAGRRASARERAADSDAV